MYIDPNSGGMLFQILAVAFTTVSGFFLVFSGKIRAYFAEWRRRNRKDAGENAIEEKK